LDGPSPQGGGGGLDTRVHQRRAMNSFRGCGGTYPLTQCIACGWVHPFEANIWYGAAYEL